MIYENGDMVKAFLNFTSFYLYQQFVSRDPLLCSKTLELYLVVP